MQEFPVNLPISLIGGTVGLILGIILGGMRLSERIKSLRILIEGGVKNPAGTDWNRVVAEVRGIEQDAKSFIAMITQVFKR